MLTARETACLEYLSHLMEATPTMIGEAIAADAGVTWSKRTCAAYGGRVAVHLSNLRPPLVMWLHIGRCRNSQAWRITAAGRAALKEPQR